MIEFLLDSDTCIKVLRGRSPEIVAHMDRRPRGSLAVSAITVAELRFGVAKSARPDYNLTLLAQLLAPFTILTFDQLAAAAYGPLRTHLERSGMSIGPLDTLIAAHALSLNLTLVTNNEREFRRVPGLVVENWTRP